MIHSGNNMLMLIYWYHLDVLQMDSVHIPEAELKQGGLYLDLRFCLLKICFPFYLPSLNCLTALRSFSSGYICIRHT